MNFTDPVIWGKLWQIVLADLVLAGDNALIIALATRSLPPRQQFWGRIFGAGGAVFLRVLFVIIIGWLLKVPFVQLIGGLLLLWIAAKLVRPQAEVIEDAAETVTTIVEATAEATDGKVAATPVKASGGGGHGKKTVSTLGAAIWMIIVADITMSLDNVVAIANIATDRATGQMHTWLVVFGLLFSIPLVVWGSTLIAKLMANHRWIIWLGGGVLGHVSASIIFHDRHVLGWMGVKVPPPGTDFDFNEIILTAPAFVMATIRYLPWVLAIFFFLYGWWMDRAATAAKKVHSA
jgi:YjbE family integral membrane protein